MRSSNRVSEIVRATTLAVAALLVGCGAGEHSASTATVASQAGHGAKAATDAAALATANMVTAVSPGKTPTDVNLKFELQQRPVVGQPVEIEVAVIPALELDRIYATFQAGEGLDLTAGAQMAQVEHPPTGVPVSHTLTVVPRRDGIFSLTAVVLADSATQSVAHTFSIPIIAGNGMADPATPAPTGTGLTPTSH